MITSVANQKGGVGKTTTAITLAVCLARRRQRVLAIDSDPQATLTHQLAIESRWLRLSLVDALAGRAPAVEAIVTDAVPGVDVLPAARELAGVEMALVAEVGRERFLADALGLIVDRYDQIVIDTPPNLGLLTVNALVCADMVIAPVSCEDAASVQGLAELRGTIARLARLRPTTPPLAAVLTRWSERRLLAVAVQQAVRELDVPVLARVAGRAVVGHAAVHRTPLALSVPDNPVTLAYDRVVEQLMAVGAR